MISSLLGKSYFAYFSDDVTILAVEAVEKSDPPIDS